MFYTFRHLGLASCLLLSVVSARAEINAEEGFGLGVVLGTPSGISASLPVGANNAFNLVAGYNLTHGPNLVVLGDYVWHRRDLIPVTTGKASLYFGPGARLELSRNPEAGIRAVIGVDYFFEGTPIQALFEIGPGINILPNTQAMGTGGLGLRYFF